ncbi:MAG: WD40 repeat domain-containing protein [Deltaproteobacteria bacterium]|nr:WD40 repeat domain-containing protein [Deltaproteobacteria bacterium]
MNITANDGYRLRLRQRLGSHKFKSIHSLSLLSWNEEETTIHALREADPGCVQVLDARTGEWIRAEELPDGLAVIGARIGLTGALILLSGIRWSLVRRTFGTRRSLVVAASEERVVSNLAVSGDGRVAVVSSSTDVTCIDLSSRSIGATVPGSSLVAVSQDGTMFLTEKLPLEQGGLAVWRSDGTSVAELPIEDSIAARHVVFTMDGSAIVVALSNGQVACWSIAQRREVWIVQLHDGDILGLDRASKSDLYFTVGQDDKVCSISLDGQVRWIRQMRSPRVGQNRMIYLRSRQILSSPSGALVAIALVGEPIRILDGVDGTARSKIDGCESEVHCLALSPDGRWVAYGGDDGQLQVRGAQTGEEKWQFPVDLDAVRSVQFDHDGTSLWTSGEDGAIREWLLESGCEDQRGEVPGLPLVALHRVMDGNRMLIRAGDRLQLWDDASPRQPVWIAEFPGRRLVAAAPSTREQGVVLTCHDSVVDASAPTQMSTVNVTTGRVYLDPCPLPGRLVALAETSLGVFSVSIDAAEVVVREEWGRERCRRYRGDLVGIDRACVSADGRWLFVANEQRIQVFDLASGQGVASVDLEEGDDRISSLVLARNEEVVAVGTALGCVLVFSFECESR